MAIYTRTGDGGETDLPDGARVPKDAAVPEAYGALDELNALLGLARCESLFEGADALLEQVQRRLFDVGAYIASYGKSEPRVATFGPADVAAIERAIDRCEAALESTNTFVLPAGSRGAALLHCARAVCRRTERRLVSLGRCQPQAVCPTTLAYINRLSDLLYVMARTENAQAGVGETPC